jgi:uncharacterized protein YlxW (UPF0749 family)
MKSGHKTILIILFILIAVACLYIFREKIAVVIASVYGAGMIIIRKFQSFFTDDDEKIEEIEKRLKELHEIESNIIDRLQTERTTLKTDIALLNSKINELETGVEQKESELNNFDSYDHWEDSVWNKLSADEQNSLKKDVTGDEFDLSEFRYSDM